MTHAAPQVGARVTPGLFAPGQSVADLVGETCRALDAMGANIGPPKVSRLVHRWVEHVQYTGYSFDRWIASGVQRNEQKRRETAFRLRNEMGTADPTGQRAAHNVDRGRRSR